MLKRCPYSCLLVVNTGTCLYLNVSVTSLFLFFFVPGIIPQIVNKQHPSNEELLTAVEFFKGELLSVDHLPRYHLVRRD